MSRLPTRQPSREALTVRPLPSFPSSGSQRSFAQLEDVFSQARGVSAEVGALRSYKEQVKRESEREREAREAAERGLGAQAAKETEATLLRKLSDGTVAIPDGVNLEDPDEVRAFAHDVALAELGDTADSFSDAYVEAFSEQLAPKIAQAALDYHDARAEEETERLVNLYAEGGAADPSKATEAIDNITELTGDHDEATRRVGLGIIKTAASLGELDDFAAGVKLLGGREPEAVADESVTLRAQANARRTQRERLATERIDTLYLRQRKGEIGYGDIEKAIQSAPGVTDSWKQGQLDELDRRREKLLTDARTRLRKDQEREIRNGVIDELRTASRDGLNPIALIEDDYFTIDMGDGIEFSFSPDEIREEVLQAEFARIAEETAGELAGGASEEDLGRAVLANQAAWAIANGYKEVDHWRSRMDRAEELFDPAEPPPQNVIDGFALWRQLKRVAPFLVEHQTSPRTAMFYEAAEVLAMGEGSDEATVLSRAQRAVLPGVAKAVEQPDDGDVRAALPKWMREAPNAVGLQTITRQLAHVYMRADGANEKLAIKQAVENMKRRVVKYKGRAMMVSDLSPDVQEDFSQIADFIIEGFVAAHPELGYKDRDLQLSTRDGRTFYVMDDTDQVDKTPFFNAGELSQMNETRKDEARRIIFEEREQRASRPSFWDQSDKANPTTEIADDFTRAMDHVRTGIHLLRLSLQSGPINFSEGSVIDNALASLSKPADTAWAYDEKHMAAGGFGTGKPSVQMAPFFTLLGIKKKASPRDEVELAMREFIKNPPKPKDIKKGVPPERFWSHWRNNTLVDMGARPYTMEAVREFLRDPPPPEDIARAMAVGEVSEADVRLMLDELRRRRNEARSAAKVAGK